VVFSPLFSWLAQFRFGRLVNYSNLNSPEIDGSNALSLTYDDGNSLSRTCYSSTRHNSKGSNKQKWIYWNVNRSELVSVLTISRTKVPRNCQSRHRPIVLHRPWSPQPTTDAHRFPLSFVDSLICPSSFESSVRRSFASSNRTDNSNALIQLVRLPSPHLPKKRKKERLSSCTHTHFRSLFHFHSPSH
jgi:hypothetical protein